MSVVRSNRELRGSQYARSTPRVNRTSTHKLRTSPLVTPASPSSPTCPRRSAANRSARGRRLLGRPTGRGRRRGRPIVAVVFTAPCPSLVFRMNPTASLAEQVSSFDEKSRDATSPSSDSETRSSGTQPSLPSSATAQTQRWPSQTSSHPVRESGAPFATSMESA